MNIVEPILHHCRWQPMALALHSPGSRVSTISYGQLGIFIDNASCWLAKQGMARGDTVAVLIRDQNIHVILLLALAKMGIVTVSAREKKLPPELKVDAFLTEAAVVVDENIRKIVFDEVCLQGGHGSPVHVADVPEGDPCRIVLTSGTTSEPKAIVRPARHLFGGVARFQTMCGARFSECSRIFVSMGLSTGFGFNFLLYILSRGGAAILPGADPMRNLEAIVALKVQAIIGSPRGMADLAALCEKVGTVLEFAAVVTTGSLMAPPLLQQLNRWLSTNVITIYGTSETGSIAAAPASMAAAVQDAVGYVLPGVEVSIVDRAGRDMPRGERGLVRVRGKIVLGGYVGDEGLTRERFRDGGFYSGDIGSIAQDGMLLISGREGTVINLGGDKVNPESIETAMIGYEPVRDAGIFELTTPVGIQLLGGAISWRANEDIEGLKSFLSNRLPGHHIPTHFIGVDAVPRNEVGKIDRPKLKQVAAAQFNVVKK
jgi:acyl-coenzyme A synthetase/AMP-(fatty) acid ligase